MLVLKIRVEYIWWLQVQYTKSFLFHEVVNTTLVLRRATKLWGKKTASFLFAEWVCFDLPALCVCLPKTTNLRGKSTFSHHDAPNWLHRNKPSQHIRARHQAQQSVKFLSRFVSYFRTASWPEAWASPDGPTRKSNLRIVDLWQTKRQVKTFELSSRSTKADARQRNRPHSNPICRSCFRTDMQE